MTQGESATKKIKVINTGTLALSNAQISLSGIPSTYYTFDITTYSTIGQGLSKNFTLTIALPQTAVVGNYTVVITVVTSAASARDTKTFKLKILPSNKTISTLNSTYNTYLSVVNELEQNITNLEAKGISVSALRTSLSDIRAKLNQTNSSLSAKDYYTAQVLLNQVDSMVSDIRTRIANAVAAPPGNATTNASGNATGGVFTFPDLPWLYIGIGIAVAAIVAVLLYLFWPEREHVFGYHPKHGWIPKKKENTAPKIQVPLKRKEVQWKPVSKKDEKKMAIIVDNLTKTKEEKKLDSIINRLRRR